MPRPPRSDGAQTREKILDVALELFTQWGYEKTSLRDIAERLGITKAALYYHFARKEEILLELHLRLHALGTDLLAQVEALPDGPERVAAWKTVTNGLIDSFLANRDLMLLHTRNRNAMQALHENERNRLENEDVELRLRRLLSSDAIALRDRIRMAAVIGIITEVLIENNDAFTDVAPEDVAAHIREMIEDLLPSALADSTAT